MMMGVDCDRVGRRFPLLVILIYGILAGLGALLVYYNSVPRPRATSFLQPYNASRDMSLNRRFDDKCEELINASVPEQRLVLELVIDDQRSSVPLILDGTQNCRLYKRERGYIYSVPTGEDIYPIAYSIAVKNDAVWLERTLMAVYHPHNVYCLHVPASLDVTTSLAAAAIANCFHNVFISANASEFGELAAEFSCAGRLLATPDWRYHVSINDYMFPLKTNTETVMIMKALDGFSIIHVNRPHHAATGATSRLAALVHELDRHRNQLFTVLTRSCFQQVVSSRRALEFLTLITADAESQQYFIGVAPGNASDGDGVIPGHVISMSTNITLLVGHLSPALPSHSCPQLEPHFSSHQLFLSLYAVDHIQLLHACLQCSLRHRQRRHAQSHTDLDVSYYSRLRYVVKNGGVTTLTAD